MKYIVMECHEGYAVLMDEESRFVTAANPGYSVGETVTEPVLMPADDGSARRRRGIIMKVTAAAACLAIICGTGYHYYSVNYKTYSTVIISSSAGVKLDLNKKGKVIKLESTSPEGEAILSEYDGKGKDKSSAINDILEIGISKGYLSGGDTVSVYISEDSYREELEKDIEELSLKADVKPIEIYEKETPKEAAAPVTKPTDEAPQPPSPPARDEKGTEPLPPHENGRKDPEPPQPPSEPEKPEPPSPPAEPPAGNEEAPTEPVPPEAPQPPTGELRPEDDPLREEPSHHEEKHHHERKETDAGEPREHEKTAAALPEPAAPLPGAPVSP